MTITDIKALVSDGACTWLQVHETLINAGTTHSARRQYLDGKVALSPTSNAMLGELVRSGVVPLSGSDRRRCDSIALPKRG